MKEKFDTTLDIEYQKATDYKLFPATGAWGGPTPQGEILCNFFVEHTAIPKSVTLTINKGVVQPGEASEPSRIVRELQTAVIMRPDIAKSIGEWLIRKAEEVLTKSKLNS